MSREEDRLLKRPLLLLAAAVALAATSPADTLVMRSGSRVEGDLVEVRGSTIEFAENGGSTRRYDRSDVAQIELGSGSGSGFFSGSHSGGRPSGLREHSATVEAASAWNDTGVDVRSGQTVFFEASGKV